MSDPTQDFWQPWPGPTGTTGPPYLGVTGAVTGPAFFGVTGATAPTGATGINDNVCYLYSRARVELAGASDAMIRMVTYDVFHEFFNDTSCWLEGIPGLIQPGAIMYELLAGNSQSLGDPFPTGRIIGLAGLQDLNQFPISAQMPSPPILQLQFAPSNTQSVFATVIKSVNIPFNTTDLPTVPPWVVPQYEQWLMAGIKGKLMQQPNRPYSDPKNGMLQYQQFRQGVNIARVRALRRNMWGSQGWFYPQEYATRSQRGWVVTSGVDRWF